MTTVLKPFDDNAKFSTVVSGATGRDYDHLEGQHETLIYAEENGFLADYKDELGAEVQFYIDIMAYSDGYHTQLNPIAELADNDPKIAEYLVKLFKYIKRHLETSNDDNSLGDYDSLSEFAQTELYKQVLAYIYENQHMLNEWSLQDSISWLVHEELPPILNDLAPTGFYFGGNEGDGSQGFWTSYFCPDCQDCENLTFTFEQEIEITCSCGAKTDNADDWQIY